MEVLIEIMNPSLLGRGSTRFRDVLENFDFPIHVLIKDKNTGDVPASVAVWVERININKKEQKKKVSR